MGRDVAADIARRPGSSSMRAWSRARSVS